MHIMYTRQCPEFRATVDISQCYDSSASVEAYSGELVTKNENPVGSTLEEFN